MIEGDRGTARFGDDFDVLDREPVAGGESVRAMKALRCTALTPAGGGAPLVGTWVGMDQSEAVEVMTQKNKRATSQRQRTRTQVADGVSSG